MHAIDDRHGHAPDPRYVDDPFRHRSGPDGATLSPEDLSGVARRAVGYPDETFGLQVRSRRAHVGYRAPATPVPEPVREPVRATVINPSLGGMALDRADRSGLRRVKRRSKTSLRPTATATLSDHALTFIARHETKLLAGSAAAIAIWFGSLAGIVSFHGGHAAAGSARPAAPMFEPAAPVVLPSAPVVATAASAAPSASAATSAAGSGPARRTASSVAVGAKPRVAVRPAARPARGTEIFTVASAGTPPATVAAKREEAEIESARRQLAVAAEALASSL